MCWLKTTSSQILCEIMTLKVITSSNLEPDTRIISLVKQHHHITSDDHMIHSYQALMPRRSLTTCLAQFIAMLTSLKSTLSKQRKKWRELWRGRGLWPAAEEGWHSALSCVWCWQWGAETQKGATSHQGSVCVPGWTSKTSVCLCGANKRAAAQIKHHVWCMLWGRVKCDRNFKSTDERTTSIKIREDAVNESI